MTDEHENTPDLPAARAAAGDPPTGALGAPASAVAPHAAPYAGAVAALKALLPEIEGRWTTPVVHDWDVHATFAHLLAADEALAVRLGIAPRVPGGAGEQGPHWRDDWHRRTNEVIAHERDRTPAETVADWSAQAAALLATPESRDRELAARATELMGLRLPVAEHFLVRAFELWIHTGDIGRALGLTVPPPPEDQLWRIVRLGVRILGAALGPTAPPVLFVVTGGDEWVLGSADDPVRAELTLEPVDFCLLVGGRHRPDDMPYGADGDADTVRNVLERAASLSWL
ncbi:maleylpyruvate isomerase family mycothiol-dependent enzyme [Streptomyces sp. NPDC088387]|uniref:maleylpyruvate isomerase family mycothiol-dependent enzyme n=1 Tax=Streptomyces sp. NPDC088387 TaxID=3365859 RepID=UPI003809548B